MTRQEQSALDAVMDFLDNYSKRDVEGCMAAMAASRPIFIMGTNDNEIFKSAEEVCSAFARDFENMADIRWGKHRNMHVEATPSLACVIVEMPISYLSEGKKVQTLFRYALALIKENKKWKICSGMASVPFASGTYSFSQ